MVRVLIILELLLAVRVMLLAAAGDPWPIGHGLTWRTSGGWVGVAYSRPDPAWAAFQAQLPYGAVVSYQLAPPLKKVNAWVVRWRRWQAVGTYLAVSIAIDAPPTVLGERDGWVIRQRHVGRARMLADEYGIRAWFLVALLLVHPVVHAVMAWRRRPRAGCCLGCGYDLRGAASARCPECGRLIDEGRRAPADARI